MKRFELKSQVWMGLLVSAFGFSNAWAKTQVKGKKSIVSVVGFRTQEGGVERGFLDELTKQLSKESSIALTQEMNTQKTVQDEWQDATRVLEEKVKAARDAFVEGKKLYDRLNLTSAIGYFNTAVSGYREGIGALKTNRYLLLSHLYLGMSLVILGREEEGQKYIREMVILDPRREQRTLSSREFSPKVVSIHREMTKKVLMDPSGTIKLTVTPPDAKVYLNGLLQTGSREFEMVVPVGEHFVVVEHNGYRQFTKRMFVSPGVNSVEAELEPFQPFSVYNQERRNNLIAVEDLNRVSKNLISQILVLGSTKQLNGTDRYECSAQLFDARHQEFSGIEAIVVQGSDARAAGKKMAKRLMGHISKNGNVVAEIQSSRPNLQYEDKPQGSSFERASRSEAFSSKQEKAFYQKKWFWGVVGGAVAAGVGSYFLLNPKAADHHILVINQN